MKLPTDYETDSRAEVRMRSGASLRSCLRTLSSAAQSDAPSKLVSEPLRLKKWQWEHSTCLPLPTSND